MKRNLLLLACLLIFNGLQAQFNLEAMVFTTGGSFAAPGNLVKVHSFETGEEELNIIGEFSGDFSNAVVADGRYAYAHIGRAAGNPAGTDIIYKIDLITFEVTDSISNIPGAAHLEVYEDWLIVSKGFSAQGASLEFYNKNDLNAGSISESNEITVNIGGQIVQDDKLYLSFTQADTGRIAVYDLGGDLPAYESEITLDTLSKGIGKMIADDDFIYATSNFAQFDAEFNLIYSFAGLTRIDLDSGDFETGAFDFADSPLVTGESPFGTIVIGNFGSAGNIVDAGSLEPFGFGFLPGYTAGVADGVNTYLWVLVTDYSSFGLVEAYDSMGELVYSFDTDISGTAIAPAYNFSPTANNDMYQGAFVSTHYDVLENDTDIDGTQLTLIEVSDVVGGTAVISEDNRVEATFDEGVMQMTFDYTMIDDFGRPASASVVIDNFTATEELSTSVALTVSPNPAADAVRINLQSFDSEEVMLTLRDLQGRVAAARKVQGTDNFVLDISDVVPGVYILEAVGAGLQGRTKVVKY